MGTAYVYVQLGSARLQTMARNKDQNSQTVCITHLPLINATDSFLEASQYKTQKLNHGSSWPFAITIPDI